MKVSHSRQRQFGVLLTYLQMFLGIVVNVVCTPIILNKLGQSEYGIYNLTSSIISYLSLLTLGFGASYIKFYSKYKAENNEDGIKKLNGLYLIVFSIMGLVALALGLIISFNSSILFNETYSTNDLRIAKILMLLLSFNMAVSFPASVFTSIIASQEEFIFQRIVNIGKTVLAPAISIVVIFFGYGSIGMVAVTTVISLIIDFINVFYCTKILKVKFKFGKIDGKLLKEIAIFSFFIAINQLIDQINTQTDKIILGKMINASAVAIYAIAATIQAMYGNFSTAVNSVFAPKIHSIVNLKEKDTDDKLTEIFIKIGRIQYFILMLVMTGYIFFGKYFVVKWAGADYELAYYVVLILMIPSTVPLIQNIGIEIQRAKNKHQFRSLVYLFVAVINIIISIILCKYYGIIGVAIGTAFANIVGCCIIMNIYYHKKLGINIIKFWKSIFRASLGLIIPVVSGVLIMNFIKFNNFAIYLCFILIYTIIYLISIYLLGMNLEEKKFLKKVLKKMKRALKNIIFLLIKPFLILLSKFKKKRIVFISFAGTQYSDNPKSISKYMHQCYPGIKQVFLINDKKKFRNIIPNYIKVVKNTKVNQYIYMITSMVIVDNNSLICQNSKYFIKTKNQLIIETWHGDRGFKKVFKANNNENINYTCLGEDKIDYFLTGSTFAEKSAKEMFDFKGEYLKVGCPRNDVLFRNDTTKYEELRKRLKLEKDTQILLYAPTYRSYTSDEMNIDFSAVLDELEKKTKKKWVVVYRMHHASHFKTHEKFIDGRALFNDMADLLPYVDFLITDYSSCAGDFALTGKPMILYLPDYDDYEKEDKGCFFNINESPYLKAKTNLELCELIKKTSQDEYRDNCKQILEFYGCYEKGNASDEVCDLIFKFLNKGRNKL